MIISEQDKESVEKYGHGIRYFFNGATCGKTSNSVMVDSWLAQFSLDPNDPFFISWSALLADVALTFRTIEEKMEREVYLHLMDFTFCTLYLGYDIALPFLPQFHERDKAMRAILEQLKTHLDTDTDEK